MGKGQRSSPPEWFKMAFKYMSSVADVMQIWNPILGTE